MADLSYSAPVAAGPLDARLALPGSKSLTNRELVLAALADGPSRLIAPLHARDTELMVEALRELGADVREERGEGAFGADWVVKPVGLAPSTRSARSGTGLPPSQRAAGEHPHPARPEGQRPLPERAVAERPLPERAEGESKGRTSLNVGLAGTVMRFLPPVAALSGGTVTFDGDESARRRPMATMTNALRALGVQVEGDALPFTVHGTRAVRGGELTIDASASSQFVSGLLLAASRFTEGLVLRHEGARLPSLPHIEMTIACLAARGVEVTSPDEGVWIVPPQRIAARDVAIEPDLSNAAPFLAAALVAGGQVSIEGWPGSTTQVGDDLRELLVAFGGEISLVDGLLTVRGSGAIRSPGRLDLSRAGELAPNLVGLAALADGPTEFTGIGHLRGHETDRLQALADDLGGLGGRVTILADGLAIEPGPLHGGPWRAYEDHRMATTGALIGLAVPGVVVDDIGTTAKTLPEFRALWERMLG
ncbi:MAG TPA: 3-phosphoshikimate 1-carboxyvinyltransferase [Microbacteriaceae bacterium]|nr:3-phosphoshikimate 1-carboxyvinyltransferase [Microbacteriaceae bacterium]